MIKSISFLLILTCMALTGDDKKVPNIALKELNVSVENAYAKIKPVVKGERIISSFGDLSEITEKDLTRIDKALDKLVKIGAYAELRIQLDTNGPAMKEVEDVFGQQVEKMKGVYGPYVVEEMLFSRLRIMKFPLKQKNRIMKLCFRAPKEDIKIFRELFEKSGVVIEKK